MCFWHSHSYYLCGLGQIANLSKVSVSLYVKWGDYENFTLEAHVESK